MLAQNFMTPAELDLSDKHVAALITTLGMLERGELTHAVPLDSPRLNYLQPKFTGHFNMAEWCEVHRCGTVCCIGGTAELVGDVDFAGGVGGAPVLQLFHPPTRARFEDITTDQAALALRNFLTTGSANWAEVLGKGAA